MGAKFYNFVPINVFLGTASRECSADATWLNPSFIDCSSTEFVRLENEVSEIFNQESRTVPTFVTAHTSCAFRDARFSYG